MCTSPSHRIVQVENTDSMRLMKGRHTVVYINIDKYSFIRLAGKNFHVSSYIRDIRFVILYYSIVLHISLQHVYLYLDILYIVSNDTIKSSL